MEAKLAALWADLQPLVANKPAVEGEVEAAELMEMREAGEVEMVSETVEAPASLPKTP